VGILRLEVLFVIAAYATCHTEDSTAVYALDDSIPDSVMTLLPRTEFVDIGLADPAGDAEANAGKAE